VPTGCYVDAEGVLHATEKSDKVRFLSADRPPLTSPAACSVRPIRVFFGASAARTGMRSSE